MGKVSKHSKERIVERNGDISTFREAKQLARVAYSSGKTVGLFQKYPEFYSFLTDKLSQSNTCTIRVYKDMVFIFKGSNKTLVTAYPIPEKYVEEMREIDCD